MTYRPFGIILCARALQIREQGQLHMAKFGLKFFRVI